MFRELRAGDDQLLRDVLSDSNLTVLIGRDAGFTNLLRNAGDQADRATFLVTDDSVVSAGQQAAWFGNGGASVVLLDYNDPRRVAARFGPDDHPTDIIDAVLGFEAAQRG